MKKIIAILLTIVMLAGCTTRTDLGECIGAFDDGEPGLQYKASIWNTFLAVILFETVIVPIWVVVDLAKCPVKKYPVKK